MRRPARNGLDSRLSTSSPVHDSFEGGASSSHYIRFFVTFFLPPTATTMYCCDILITSSPYLAESLQENAKRSI